MTKPFSRLDRGGSRPNSLTWRQPKFSEDHYELVGQPAGEALYATIGWLKWLSDQAVACSAYGNWYFDRLGWTRRTITVTRPVKPAESSGMVDRPPFERLATFDVGWFWEGDLALSSGEIFHWYGTKVFRSSWALTEVLPPDDLLPAETGVPGKPARGAQKRRSFRFGRPSKLPRRERLVYEIEFGMHWLKQEAWITLPAPLALDGAELTMLLCLGMYLGYCYNQDSAAAVAASSTAAVS